MSKDEVTHLKAELETERQKNSQSDSSNREYRHAKTGLKRAVSDVSKELEKFKSKQRKDFHIFLVFVDALTRYPIAVPVHNITAHNTARALVEHVVCRILSDAQEH